MVGTGRRAGERRVTTARVLLATLLAAGLTAGCTASNGTGDDGRGSPRASHSGGPDGTNRDDRPPVLAVKIDNSPAARPQSGLESADVVYVEQVEGGLSRLMAVYATRLPESVGPVRSAREADLELLSQFDRPVLAFSGAQGRLLPLIDRAPLDPLTPGTPGSKADVYVRGTTRSAPHNLYLQPRQLMDEPPGRPR